MPEIGECYSIASKIPQDLGEVKSIEYSKDFLPQIGKKKEVLITLKESTFLKVKAFGKSIWFYIKTKNGDLAILTSQLGMTGSWFLNDVMNERKHNHLILHFDKIKLRYSDPRMFGKMNVFTGNSYEEIEEQIIKQKKWGIDPILSSESDILTQIKKMLKSDKKIKSKLLEQNLIFGIGNYLASEILFKAKINPNRKCSSLTEKETSDLAKSIKHWVILAKNNGGYAFAGGYIQPDGSLGSVNLKIKIYNHAGKPCPVCSNPIQSIFLDGRNTYFCKKCQK